MPPYSIYFTMFKEKEKEWKVFKEKQLEIKKMCNSREIIYGKSLSFDGNERWFSVIIVTLVWSE